MSATNDWGRVGDMMIKNLSTATEKLNRSAV